MRVLDGCAGYGVDGRVRISDFKFEISNQFNCYTSISLLCKSCFDSLMNCSSLLGSLRVFATIPHMRWIYEPL
jgi:hypothetical protein